MKLSNRIVLFNDGDLSSDVNSAAKDIQTIYIQAVSGTLSVNAPSAWVSVSDEPVTGTPPNASAGQTPHWTTKRPTYQSNYPITFIAEQRRGVNGQVTYSTPLKDDSQTIIDGGHITTGTIDASQVNVTNINGQNIVAGTLSVLGKEGEASIEITSDALVGHANGGTEVFNFATSEVAVTVQKQQVISANLEFPDIPDELHGYTTTLECAPVANWGIAVEIDLYRLMDVSKYASWFTTVYGGTAGRASTSFAFDGVTYEVTATYDGDKTISGIGINVVTSGATKTSALYASKIYINYYTNGTAPCYELGGNLEATGAYSVAEGFGNTASGDYSHAEGKDSQAVNDYSHAEGLRTEANGFISHAEGCDTEASGYYSHAGGVETIAQGWCQTAIGRANVADTTSLFIIGNGTIGGTRSNALTVDQNGDVTLKNHTSPIGTVKYASLSADKSVQHNTNTMLCSISLDAGVWVVVAGLRWATNTSGYRKLNIATTSGASDIHQTTAPNSGNYTQMMFTRILTVDSDNTVHYLNGLQNSGSALNALAGGNNWGTYMTAVRIA